MLCRSKNKKEGKGLKKTAVVIALLVLLLAGCGFKDIDKRFFVTAIGIDNSGNPDKKDRSGSPDQIQGGPLKKHIVHYRFYGIARF
jgi:hypothetical protein